jgi:hypothetical protein
MTEGGSDSGYRSPSINWGAFLDQVVRDYNTEPARGLAHGLQKEAVQNSHGARDGGSGIRWECRFQLLEATDETPRLLTIVDQGTYGLTGHVFPHSRDLPAELESSERLARFESMFDSGGNAGPGLFGRGKLIFNACSEDRLIFYDALTRDGEYRFGVRHFKGRDCDQYTKVLEGPAAHARLKELTGGALQPLTSPGTRITIVRPLREVVDAVESGRLLSAIEETWWEIVQKEGAEISVTPAKGAKQLAGVPAAFGGLPRATANKWRVYLLDNQIVTIGTQAYKVKHLHFLIAPTDHKIDEELLGVYIHRRGMRVGRISVAGLPEDLGDRFFGYVQLDAPFEAAIAECENTTHYGFSHTKRPEFRELRKWVQDNANIFLEKIGYGPKTDPNERARQQAEQALAALNGILNDLGVPNIGLGEETERGFLLTVEGLRFPNGVNSLKSGAVLAGFHFAVENRTQQSQEVHLEVISHERDRGEIEQILPKTMLRMDAGDTHNTARLTIALRPEKYPSGKKIVCTARLTNSEGREVARRSFSFYVDTAPPDQIAAFAEVELTEIEYPRRASKRVDLGQSLLGLTYLVTNLTATPMRTRLKVRTFWPAEGTEIDQIAERDVLVSPFGSEKLEIPEVKVSKEKYEEVGRAKLKLRCTATALEATATWEKGLRLAEHTTLFYLGMDPGYGLFEDTTFVGMGEEGPRSQAEPTAGLTAL